MVFYRAYRKDSDARIPDYCQRLKALGLKSLRFGRAAADLVFCFRILRKEVRLPASKYWVFRPCSIRTGSFNLHYVRIRNNSYSKLFNFLFFRVARWMELLPTEVLQSENSLVFKKKLENLDLLQLLE